MFQELENMTDQFVPQLTKAVLRPTEKRIKKKNWALFDYVFARLDDFPKSREFDQIEVILEGNGLTNTIFNIFTINKH